MNDYADDGVEPDHAYAPDHDAGDATTTSPTRTRRYDPTTSAARARRRRSAASPAAWPCSSRSRWSSAARTSPGPRGSTTSRTTCRTSADYDGPGHGKVIFEVKEGDSTTAIGRNLKNDNVVASVDAFISAANGDKGIQVGFYPLKKEMKAADAYKVLKNPDNIIKDTVTIPEGLRVTDVVAILADQTKYSTAQFNAALKDTEAIGLPAYAKGNPEGYLFPSTYPFGPTEKPVDMIKDMVDRWRQAAAEHHLVAGAQEVGKTPAEIMTIASLIQAEGRGSDMPKISRVIYNRLDGPGSKQGTNGLLQIDATVNYALNRKGVVAVTTDETQNTDSPYNTYKYPGLPPGPINSPGDEAIDAALHPADGPWYYYLTVNLRTGETKFGVTYQDFLGFKQEYDQYCTTSTRC